MQASDAHQTAKRKRDLTAASASSGSVGGSPKNEITVRKKVRIQEASVRPSHPGSDNDPDIEDKEDLELGNFVD